MQAEMQRLDTTVVPFFRDPHIVDVTADYAKTYKKELEIPASMLYSGKPRSRIAYLCGSSRMDWELSLIHISMKGDKEEITLIPMGAARLRISAFPNTKE